MSSPKRLLIVEDNADFRRLLEVGAQLHGFEPHAYASLVDLGSFARIREFDVAMLDYYLESLTGDEIAQYVDTFFSHIPVIVVSAHRVDKDAIKWPKSVRAFVSKEHGVAAIMAVAQQVLEQQGDTPACPWPLNAETAPEPQRS